MGGGKPGKYLFCKDSHSDQKDDSSKNAGKGEQTTTFMGFCGIYFFPGGGVAIWENSPCFFLSIHLMIMTHVWW